MDRLGALLFAPRRWIGSRYHNHDGVAALWPQLFIYIGMVGRRSWGAE